LTLRKRVFPWLTGSRATTGFFACFFVGLALVLLAHALDVAQFDRCQVTGAACPSKAVGYLSMPNWGVEFRAF
jgi:hypothetical protein